MTKIRDVFRLRLDLALAENDMKPVDLAKKTGLSEATISQYRSGYAKPKDERLVLVADALEVDPAWLMGMDVPMRKSEALLVTEQDEKDLVLSYRDADEIEKLLARRALGIDGRKSDGRVGVSSVS